MGLQLGCRGRSVSLVPVVAALAAVASLVSGVLGALASDASATFRGRNGLVFFCRNDEPGWDIVAVEANGSGQHRLTRGGCEPSVSADGRKIVFVGAPGGGQLFVMNKDGSGRQRIPVSTACGNPKTGPRTCALTAETPSFSPDGSEVVFDDTQGHIWVVNVNGSGLVDLTPGSASNLDGAFSPDGKAILFEREQCFRSPSYHCQTAMFLMNPNGTDIRRVPNSANAQEASFSPSAKTIVFMRHGDIFKMNLDGSHRRRLTTAPAGGEDLTPQFSPDGRLIVFERLDNTTHFDALVVMHADGSHLRKLAQAKYVAVWPAWQPRP